MSSDARLLTAEARATCRGDCPVCRCATWWPADTAALEITCDCGHALRREPDGTLYDCGVAEAACPSAEPATDPDDLEVL